MTAPNPTIQLMKEHDIPLTWQNFLAVEYFGTPPELDAEVEAELIDAYDAAIWHELGIEQPEEDV